MLNISQISTVAGCWRIAGDDTVGYAIVRAGKSLLVDCPAGVDADALITAGIPEIEVILHTQVQAEHCYEWQSIPGVPVYVAESAREVALVSNEYIRDSKTVWPPDRGWDTRGEEKYGIGGCVTERPPKQPLNVKSLFAPGDKFYWNDVELDVIALPGSGKRAIGFSWLAENIIFTGDLFHGGGYVVNLYDIERSYGIPSGYDQMIDSLQKVLELSPRLCLPSTGPIINEVKTDIARLLPLLNDPCRVTPLRSNEKWALTGFQPIRTIGTRWRENFPGVYQNCNFGNMILFIDGEGRGLAIDPDICVWDSWQDSIDAFHADLDLLEKEAGLKTIERALVTHYHGDHFQNAPELRKRYGTRIQATGDVAAAMARPYDFPYPCMVDWYGFPFDNIVVDDILTYNKTENWHGATVTPIHTPGHCNAHTGYAITMNSKRIFCSGDAVQYGAGPINANMPLIYNDTAWPARSLAITIQRMMAFNPEYILGGHSHTFQDINGSILRDMLTVQLQAEENLCQLISDGNTMRAMTPPSYDEHRIEN
jgi:glyoxylase-like metal-dependent hydrolase (beta-lactamase superfamily II)